MTYSNDCANDIVVSQCVCQGLDDYNSHAFAPAVAIGSAVKAVALSIGAEKSQRG